VLQKIRKFIISVFILDIVIILSHIFLGNGNEFYNLDKEYNLPSAYSALKLISIGIIAIVIFISLQRKKAMKKWQEIYSWIVFGSLFVYLGFDEFFTIHEKTIDYLKPSLLVNLDWFENQVFYWVLLFLPFIALALVLFYYFIKTILTKFRFSRNFFIGGAIFFALVIVLEFIGGFSEGVAGYVLMTFEESFEVFGATCFLIGGFYYWKKING